MLTSSLENPTNTAIESDIVFGTCNDDDEKNIGEQIQPIMAQPTSKTRNLSFKKFWEMSTFDSNISSKNMKKHLNTLGNVHEYCAYSIDCRVDCCSFFGYSSSEVEATK